MIGNAKRKNEMRVERGNVSLHNFKMKGSFSKRIANSKPVYLDPSYSVSDIDKEVPGLVNEAYEVQNDDGGDDGRKRNQFSSVYNTKPFQKGDEEECRDLWRKPRNEIVNNDEREVNHGHSNFARFEEEKNINMREIVNDVKDFHKRKRSTMNSYENTDVQQNRMIYKADENRGIEHVTQKIIRDKKEIETEQMRRNEENIKVNLHDEEAKKEEDNLKVVYRCRRIPPINPSIIVTTEPFGKLEKMGEKIEEESNETDFRSIDFVGEKYERKREELCERKNDVNGGYLNVKKDEEKNEVVSYKIRGTQMQMKNSDNNQDSDLPITEINDYNDYNDINDYDKGDQQISGYHRNHEYEKGTQRQKLPESATPVLDTNVHKVDERSLEQSLKSLESHLIRRQQDIESNDQGMINPRSQSARNSNASHVKYGYRYIPQQISISEAVKQLRKKRDTFASRKNKGNIQSRPGRSTESSLKSTDGDDRSSEASFGRDELRGVFKNLNEQHKIIEKRSDSMINFRPSNRCDARLVSTAYEMASAMELRGQSIKQDYSDKTRNSAVGHNTLDDRNALGFNIDILDTSKPSTNTSYLNADCGSLQSNDEINANKWFPNWLYIVFTVLVWNCVLAFMHAIEADQMTICNQSIKWRLWCTIATCALLDFFLELLCEKKTFLKSAFSSLLVFSILLSANQNPLMCHVTAETIKVMHYIRASMNIVMSFCLFIYWFKTGMLQRVPSIYDGKERKLSETPISDLENR